MFTVEYFLKNKKFYMAFFLIILIILASHIVVKGHGKDEVEFHSMKATAYCLQGTTVDGSHTRRGIAASKPEWIGLTAAVYLDDNGELGEFLGYYEIKDTGGSGVRSGKVLDIWLPTYDECIQFGKKKVLVALIKGAG